MTAGFETQHDWFQDKSQQQYIYKYEQVIREIIRNTEKVNKNYPQGTVIGFCNQIHTHTHGAVFWNGVEVYSFFPD